MNLYVDSGGWSGSTVIMAPSWQHALLKYNTRYRNPVSMDEFSNMFRQHAPDPDGTLFLDIEGE